MWLNCYFPTDPQTMQYDDEELVQVLEEIENVLDNNVFDDCIIGGDFNYDTCRATGFATIVRDFFRRIGLISVWEKFPINYTHLHTDSKSTSTIDHFFVNEKLLEQIHDAGPLHLGDNLSRHSPIMIKVKVEQVEAKIQQSAALKPRKLAWYKASQDHIDVSTALLDNKLRELVIPEELCCQDLACKCTEHSIARDKHVIDILCTLVESSYQCIPLTARSRQGSRSTKAVGQALPGWNECVAPLKSDSLFWHSIWLSAGRPNSGALFQVMSHARRKYHLAVRQTKRRAANSKAMDLLAASEAGDIALMEELRKSLKGKSEQQVPDSLEGKVTHEDILEKIKECYEQLYNSANTDLAMNNIKEKLEQLITTASM